MTVRNKKFDLQLSQDISVHKRLSRSIPELHIMLLGRKQTKNEETTSLRLFHNYEAVKLLRVEEKARELENKHKLIFG